MRKINIAGVALIKEFEGCKLEAYKCPAGVWTIGYGHTGAEVVKGCKIDLDTAGEILDKDLTNFSVGVDKLVTNKTITSNEFSAMCSFAFNVGLGNFKASTLLRCVNKFNTAGAAGEFMRWNLVRGIISPGLVRRREAERALFVS